MNIRVDCHNSRWHGNIEEIRFKYPNAHFEIIKRNKEHVLSPSKKLLIKIGEMKKSDGTKNKMWNLNKPEVFTDYKRELIKEFIKDYKKVDIELKRLRKIAKKKMLFLVCSCKYPERCHRSIIKELLENESPLLDVLNKLLRSTMTQEPMF